ncbi:MAG: non-catalytic member of peptidase subfamily M23B [Lysobacteraceae bacterium]|nr:MAG: non-catalytic member of peptidase subfamily M23B [Xanthomonadaceae bacterium]
MRLWLVLLLGWSIAMAQDDPEQLEQQLKEVRARIEQASRSISDNRQDKDELLEQLAAAEREIGQIGKRVRDIEREIDQTNEKIDTLAQEQLELNADLAGQREALVGQVRAAFLMGRQQQLKLMLNQQRVATIGRVNAYFRYLNEARAEQIDYIVSRLERLRAIEIETVAARSQLQSLHDQSSAQIIQRQATLKERRQLLVAIDQRIVEQGDELKRLTANEADLDRLLGELRQAFADIPGQLGSDVAFAELNGRLTWPVRGSIVEPFGRRRTSGMVSDGILIAADQGADVRAVSYGRVAFSDWLRGYGLIAIIDHGDGYLTLYGHADSLYKDVGEWVQAGEVIASVGSSGGRDAPALYFGLRKNSDPVNPRNWFAGDLR